MKKIFIVFLLLSLILMMGCQPQRSPSEVRESADELIENIKENTKETLGEERYNEIWGQDKKKETTPDIKINAVANAKDDYFQFDITVENNCGRRIYVCSSDFTLRMPGGLTIKPTTDSINTFEAIELNNGEKMQGRIYFNVY